MPVFLVILGLCCISAGVGMIYLPAGIIAGGASLVVLGFIWAKGQAYRRENRFK